MRLIIGDRSDITCLIPPPPPPSSLSINISWCTVERVIAGVSWKEKIMLLEARLSVVLNRVDDQKECVNLNISFRCLIGVGNK